MPRIVAPLTEIKINKSKPREKDYKLFDGEGLFLLVRSNGSKLWRLKYNAPLTGKEKSLSLGKYPYITLKRARELREENKRLIANGIDPNEKKKQDKLDHLKALEKQEKANSGQIHIVLNAWVKTLDNSQETLKRRIKSFENNLFPYIGVKRDSIGNIIYSPLMSDIKHETILKAIDIKKKTANETARRLLSDCKTLWGYAIAYGYANKNIIEIIPQNQRPKKQITHYAKITNPTILRELLSDIETYKGHPIIKCALMLAPYVMLRAENLTTLKCKYVDFEKQLLTIPRGLMKIKDKNLPNFKLPLTNSAIKILEEVKQFTGWSEWVFHGVRETSRHLDPNAINKALRVTLGYNDEKKGRKQTIHSFRGTFRSLTDTHQKEHNIPFIVRERVLDHQETNQVVRAYTHKADFTEEMRELLDWWEKYLDNLK
ncbi:MAG: integrase arm-type DNA-binding domain-containing protein [Campylobacterales bacterium]|nr:integrase arm-type DNA-binding domain-containing protein [Campylobacterales bacterium]